MCKMTIFGMKVTCLIWNYYSFANNEKSDYED